MMHKNPNERLKIPAIKIHPWFTLYKVSFSEDSQNNNMSQSGLISESMLLEGDDPFDDFMNKRLAGSSGGSNDRSRSDSQVSQISEFDEGLKGQESIQAKLAQNTTISFRKNRPGDSEGRILEIIPEEKISSENLGGNSGQNSATKRPMNSNLLKEEEFGMEIVR